MNLFTAVDGATVNVAANAASQSVQVQSYSGCNQIRVVNNASGTAFIKFGGSGVTAVAANDIPVLSGTTAGFSVPAVAAGNIYAAAIVPSGTGTIYFTPGQGI